MKYELLKTFLSSFKKADLKLLSTTMIYNVLFYLSSTMLSFAGFFLIKDKLLNLVNSLDLETLNSLTINLAADPSLQRLMEVRSSIIFYMIAYAIFASVVSILLWGLFKALIYSRLVKKKLNLQIFWKFVLVIVIWLSVFLLVSGSVIKIMSPTAHLIIIPLWILFSIFWLISLCISFVESKSLKDGFKTFYKIAIKKIHHLLLPWLFVSLAFIIVFAIIFYVWYLPQAIAGILSVVLFLAFSAWARFYLLLVHKNLSKSSISKKSKKSRKKSKRS